MADPPLRFIADSMLGKLARWLRILGFDAAYERVIADGDLICRATDEGRILLTRDTRLVRRRRMPRFILIESQDPAAQVRQTIGALDMKLPTGALLSRCLICNVLTEEITKEEAGPEVPPYVHSTQERFARCPRCRRIYWRATHVADIIERLGKITPGGAS